jgi:RNA polymerase sigma factor (sigma-70 family)
VISSSLQRYIDSKDPSSFQDLVREYHPMVHGICQRILGRGVEVEDAVQETFIKFAQKAGDIRANPSAWLHSCARTTALDLQRERRRRNSKEAPLMKDERTTADAVGDKMDRSEDTSIVDLCLDELSDSEREVVTAYFFVNKTQQEIADGLGVSQVAVKKRLDRALEILRHKCVRRGLVVPGLMAAFLSDLGASTPNFAMNALSEERFAQRCYEHAQQRALEASARLSATAVRAGLIGAAGLAVIGVCAWRLIGHDPAVNTPLPVEHSAAQDLSLEVVSPLITIAGTEQLVKEAPSGRVIWQADFSSGLKEWLIDDEIECGTVDVERSGRTIRVLRVKNRTAGQMAWISSPTFAQSQRFAVEYDARRLSGFSRTTSFGLSSTLSRDQTIGTVSLIEEAPWSSRVTNFHPDQWYHHRVEFILSEETDGLVSFTAASFIDDIFQRRWRGKQPHFPETVAFTSLGSEAYLANLRILELP